MLMLASAALLFAGCEKENGIGTGSNSQVSDPNGTVVANIRNGYQTELYIFPAIPIQIDDINNFTTPTGWLPGLAIVSVGQVSGLGSIKTIPQSGWSSSVAVVPSCGYVVATPWQEDGSINYDELCYARMYVEDYILSTSGGIIGAKVKYQSPFIP